MRSNTPYSKSSGVSCSGRRRLPRWFFSRSRSARSARRRCSMRPSSSVTPLSSRPVSERSEGFARSQRARPEALAFRARDVTVSQDWLGIGFPGVLGGGGFVALSLALLAGFLRGDLLLGPLGLPPLQDRLQALRELGLFAGAPRAVVAPAPQGFGQALDPSHALRLRVGVAVAAAVADLFHQARDGIADDRRDGLRGLFRDVTLRLGLRDVKGVGLGRQGAVDRRLRQGERALRHAQQLEGLLGA